jgi:hypothetical protein
MRLSSTKTKTKASGDPPETQEKGHRPPVRPCHFSIILRWERKSISVSFFDWKMLPTITADDQSVGFLHAANSLRRTDSVGIVARRRSIWRWRAFDPAIQGRASRGNARRIGHRNGPAVNRSC